MAGVRFALILLAVWCTPAMAAYLVEPGDVLMVAVAEDPDREAEAKVNADGRIAVAGLGTIDVAGLTLEAIRDRVEAEFERRDLIRDATVTVDIARYRPFYVGGVVASPGAVPYEPGLTVRHAILLAGGVDNGPETAVPTAADLLGVQGELRSASFGLLLIESRIARLRAELDSAPGIEPGAIDTSGADPAEVETVLSLDAGSLEDRLMTASADQSHLTDMLGLVDFEISVLERQTELQKNEQEMQATEVANARKLYDQGLIPLPRVQELERQRSQIARDMLESEAFAARARQTKANTNYELASVEARRRIEVRDQLAEAMLERKRLEASMEALGARLAYAGLTLSKNSGLRLPKPKVVVYRLTGAGESTPLNAEMSTPIEPGDIVEVGLADLQDDG